MCISMFCFIMEVNFLGSIGLIGACPVLRMAMQGIELLSGLISPRTISLSFIKNVLFNQETQL